MTQPTDPAPMRPTAGASRATPCPAGGRRRGPRAAALALAGAIGLAVAGPSVPAERPAVPPPALSAVAPATPEARPGETLYAETYRITLSGLALAEMGVTARLGSERYRAEAALTTAGILGAVYTAGFDATAAGRIEGRALSTRFFQADSHDSNKRQKVAMRFGPGGPVKLVAEPPFKPKPWEVDPLAQAGTNDPLSAAVSALGPRPRGELCGGTHEIYDGRRRYRIAVGAPTDEPATGLVRCPARYERLAGFKPKKMKDPVWPFALWFSERADGLWRLERAEGSTPFGTAALTREPADPG